MMTTIVTSCVLNHMVSSHPPSASTPSHPLTPTTIQIPKTTFTIQFRRTSLGIWTPPIRWREQRRAKRPRQPLRCVLFYFAHKNQFHVCDEKKYIYRQNTVTNCFQFKKCRQTRTGCWRCVRAGCVCRYTDLVVCLCSFVIDHASLPVPRSFTFVPRHKKYTTIGAHWNNTPRAGTWCSRASGRRRERRRCRGEGCQDGRRSRQPCCALPGSDARG